jgi:hypothetical protein
MATNHDHANHQCKRKHKHKHAAQAWDADEVIPGLFLGGAGAAQDRRGLAAHGITHVVAVGAGLACPFPGVVAYVRVPARDVTYQNMARFFPYCCAWVANALAGGGRVLVHCERGVSRSAVVVAAVLVSRGASAHEALCAARRARAVAAPNSAFVQQLCLWERMHCALDGDSPAHREYARLWGSSPRNRHWAPSPQL